MIHSADLTGREWCALAISSQEDGGEAVEAADWLPDAENKARLAAVDGGKTVAEQARLHSSSLAFAVSLVNPAGQGGMCYINASSYERDLCWRRWKKKKEKKVPLHHSQTGSWMERGRKVKLVIDQTGDMMDGTLFYLSDSQAQIQTTVVSGEQRETNKPTKEIQ